MLDSAQHTLEVYSNFDSQEIIARYPGSDCPSGAATARYELCIPSGSGRDASLVTHELGHNLQMQMFNQDWLRNVIVGGTWTFSNPLELETESAATTEGWASYVAAVSWYNPSIASVVPRAFGMNVETAGLNVATCEAGNSGLVPLQAAKAFWDLDDNNNEDGSTLTSETNNNDDWDSYGTVWMANQWDEFGNGSANRQDGESGDDGVNLQDYLYRVSDSTAEETMLDHNCIDHATN